MPRPILQAGVIVGDELMLYGERDFIGVESPGAEDLRGINAAAEWTRRAKASAIVEHDSEGVHSTPRIARGLCFLQWNEDTQEYVVHDGSYLRGTYYRQDSSIYTVTQIVDGEFDLDLGKAMPSATWGIVDMTRPERRTVLGVADYVWAACWGTATSTTKIRITRRSGSASFTNGFDGPCAFLLCG